MRVGNISNLTLKLIDDRRFEIYYDPIEDGPVVKAYVSGDSGIYKCYLLSYGVWKYNVMKKEKINDL